MRAPTSNTSPFSLICDLFPPKFIIFDADFSVTVFSSSSRLYAFFSFKFAVAFSPSLLLLLTVFSALVDFVCSFQTMNVHEQSSSASIFVLFLIVNIVFCFLQLEKNIRGIAFSGDWFMLFDDWLVEFPAAHARRGVVMPIQKRGPGRPRKTPAVSETTPVPEVESSNDIYWWRGGRVSRILFQRGILYRSLAKKAARQGTHYC